MVSYGKRHDDEDYFSLAWNSLEFQYTLQKLGQICPSHLHCHSLTLSHSIPCKLRRQEGQIPPCSTMILSLWTMILQTSFNQKPTGYMQRLALVTSAIVAQSPSPAYSKLTLELADGAGVIWLNSLKDLNCLSTTMAREIKEALAHLDNDPAVKIILIRSKHGKVFCAGADIKHMKAHDYTTHPHNLHFLNIERAFKNTRKPVISVVEGKALGGGFELALLTDIIIASPAASFGLPEITLGLIPCMGGTQILTRIVGTKQAMKMIMTGESISAEEAHRLNVAHLIPKDNFEGELNKMVDTLVNKASSSLEAAKKSIKCAMETTLEQGLEHETTIFQALSGKEGPNEGILAFVEKRKPNFRNM